jgi:hypothetical protein
MSEEKELPDTPRWSFWRRTFATAGLVAGLVMAGQGAFGSQPESVLLELIRTGAEIIIWTIAIVIGGAGAERGWGWWSKRK